MRPLNLPLVLIPSLLLGSLTASADDRRSGPGESCGRTADCAPALACVRFVCIDPQRDPVEPVDPRLRDSARVAVTRAVTAIRHYQSLHRVLPRSLREVVRERFIRAYQTVDPWGTPLAYDPGGESGIRVCSYGPDTLPGSGDDICGS